jgi:hypothetical protein
MAKKLTRFGEQCVQKRRLTVHSNPLTQCSVVLIFTISIGYLKLELKLAQNIYILSSRC